MMSKKDKLKQLRKIAQAKGYRIEKLYGKTEAYGVYQGAMRYIGTDKFRIHGSGTYDEVINFLNGTGTLNQKERKNA